MNSYHSTRSRAVSCTAKEAIRTGIAPDGGLFVSDALGSEKLDVTGLAEQSYADIANSVLQLLLPDYTADEIAACVHEAYDGTFASSEVTPLVPLVGHEAEEGRQPFVLELFHGPTSAFKDVALQMLPRLMARTGSASDTPAESIMIVTATSGDTGKAALAGFADAPGTGITVFYPEGKVSRVQELQMLTQKGANTSVVGIEGNFDDAQTGVKKIFGDKEFAKELDRMGFQLSSANSINIGRLVPQVVYYVYAYAKLLANGEIEKNEKVNVVVPTGNFGNILAAYFAKQMGVPFGKLICASNDNKVLYDFFRTGTYDKNREFILTTSPSMDILVSSNLERLLYLSCGRDAAKTKAMMEQLSTNGKYEITADMKEFMKDFCAGYADMEENAKEIRKVFDDTGYLIDTHTGVAAAVYEQYKAKTGDTTKTVIASTASPYKFSRSVMEAVLGKKEDADEFALIDEMERISGVKIPQAIEEIRDAKILHNRQCKPEEMEETVKQTFSK